MQIILPILVLVMVGSFLLARKVQNKIVSAESPFSFAEDMLVVNMGSSFSIQNSDIDYIGLEYNPKALQNRFYDMNIRIVKTDGNCKTICYRGSEGGTQPQDMVSALTEHHIKCVVKN